MDNKYGLGGVKVATEHHHLHHKTVASSHPLNCRFCGSTHLVLSPTMHDHSCADCGQLQNDVPAGYSSGRSSDY